jgi:hypothetical protein
VIGIGRRTGALRFAGERTVLAGGVALVAPAFTNDAIRAHRQWAVWLTSGRAHMLAIVARRSG